ncbi:hypothetical protein CP10139811_1331B, partial [Chlamydia ibidis]
NHVFSCQKSPI